MELSLFSQTDVFVMRLESRFEDHGAYGVQRTPSNPHFYAGNRLLLGEPLVPAQLPADPPDRAAFAAAGYELETTLCMTTADQPPPVSPTPGLIIQPLRPADRAAFLRFLLDCHGEWGVEFNEFQAARILERAAVLEGDWWLGRLDGQIAGSLGLYFDGGLGRFQMVDTHPAYRRRGVARTLLTQVIRHGLARPATEQLVIAADRDYFAAGLYAECGFRTVHTQVELFKPPPPD